MPETGVTEAAAVANKIRILVENAEISFDTITIPVTISLGVASLEANDTAEVLYAKADALLYRAKQMGRNRVVS